MNIDLELYRVFCEVVKYKNISKAAESMFISQSAITQSIQKLENLLGGKVFYRNKTGVELTEEGKNLYEYIQDSIETMSNAENIFSKYITLEKGRIRIGGGNTLLSSLIFDPVLKFMKKYPDVEISISSGITNALMQKLANGELDIVALNLPFKDKKYSNVEIIPLKKSTYCFFASKNYIKKHPKNGESITDKNNIFILPKAPSIKRKILDDFCSKENIELVANYEVSSSSLMKKLVLKDIGIGFTNIENLKDVKDKVTIINKIEMEDTKEGIATLKKNMSSQATIELVKLIKEHYEKN